MNPKVSVIICTYNDGRYIAECIDSILAQTFTDFELIIVNDASTDNTDEIVMSYNDPRIVYIKMEKNSGSIGKIRNYSVSRARGEYVFSTDGDCRAREDWIATGLSAFSQTDALAIEGRIVYYRENYKRTLVDRDVENKTGGLWMCANMGFRKVVFKDYNFNPDFPRLEDRELALRIIREKPIPFVSESVVYHQKVNRSIWGYLKEAKVSNIAEKIRLIREFGDKNDVYGVPLRIFNYRLLLVMLFPPLVLLEFLFGRVKTWEDLRLLPFVWVKAVYIRMLVWKAAIQERYFLL